MTARVSSRPQAAVKAELREEIPAVLRTLPMTLVGVVCLSACTPPGDRAASGNAPAGPPPSTAAHVRTAIARSSVVPLRIPIVGTLFGAEQVVVSTKVGGILRQTSADFGDRVAPGDPLTQVDSADYEVAVARAAAALGETLARLGIPEPPGSDFDTERVSTVVRAAAELENAQFTYRRTLELPGTYSTQELNDIEARLRVAEAEHRIALDEAAALVATARERAAQRLLAERALRDTLTRAPAIPSTLGAGGADHWIVAERLVTEGQYLGAASSVYRLLVVDPLRLRARVPERYLSQVRVGHGVTVEHASAAPPLKGKVVRVSPTIDASSRTFEIEALLANEGDALKPGVFVSGAIDVAEPPVAVFIPADALTMEGGATRVFIVEDGAARRRDIRVGRQSAGMVEIVEGLSGGEAVVTEGAATLIDGAAVEIIQDAASD